MGDLQGNQFTITLRDLDPEKKNEIQASLESLKQVGFINYYGMQRFGTYSIPTYEIGILLLQSKWKEAVDLLLLPKKEDSLVVQQARQIWQDTQDPSIALDKFPTRCIAERAILRYFRRNKDRNKDYLGAILSVIFFIK